MWYLKQCPKCKGDMYEDGEEIVCFQCGLRIERRLFLCGDWLRLISAIERKLSSG